MKGPATPPLPPRAARPPALLLLLAALGGLGPAPAHADFRDVCPRVWPKVVKIFGAGGLRHLQAYSSGLLVSPQGHILTVWNHVLETPNLRAVLSNGQRFEASLQLVDSSLGAAILRIEAEGLPCFDLEHPAPGRIGEWVLAFSNAFRVASGEEQPTVIHGVLSALTDLRARRGVFESTYQGPVYVVDGITNNPGAGGGALTNARGELLGMVGTELRSELTHTWLNHAVPAAVLAPLVRRALAGERSVPAPSLLARPATTEGPQGSHGLVLVPDVLRYTPAYVDAVRPGSPAEQAGLQPNDLLLFVQEIFAGTVRDFEAALQQFRPGEEVQLLVRRGEELIAVQLKLE